MAAEESTTEDSEESTTDDSKETTTDGTSTGPTEDDRFVRGEPDLDAHAPASTVLPGRTQELEVVVTNDGEILAGSVDDRNSVTKARNVRATVESDDDDPIEVDTGTRPIGSITEDRPGSTSFQLTIADDADPGEYDLEVELEYSYTRQISDRSGVTDERSTSRTRTITVEVDDDARFVVKNTSTTAPVGNAGELSLEMENVGEETAYDASVLTESTTGNVAFGPSPADETYAGSWEPGEVKTVTYDVTVDDGSSVRPYTLDTAVSFEDEDGIEKVDDGIASSVSPLPERRFVVRNATTTAPVGDSGELSLEIEHVGEQTAYDASVLTESTTKNVAFGQSPADETHAGSWEPGEVKTITYDLNVDPDAGVRPYTLDTVVSYEGEDGIEKVDDGITSSVSPLPEQTFAIEANESTLRVDEEGWIRGDVTNLGPVAVESVEVRAPFEDPNLYPIEDSYAVGDLEPGETKSFEFHLDVGSEAEPVRKLVGVDVRYRTGDRDRRVNDDGDVVFDLGERRDEFLVSSTPHEIEAGSTETLTVEVTNNRDETVTDVEPKLFADDPLSASDDVAYVPELASGETATVRFEVGADESAIAKTYAATIDVRYDDADGRGKVSDAHRTAVTVVEAEDGDDPLLYGGVLALLIVLVAGAYLWNAR